jgi:membrane-associated PAP2 superfamily phosphatase
MISLPLPHCIGATPDKLVWKFCYQPEQMKHLGLHDWISHYLLQDALQWFHEGVAVLFFFDVVEVVK